MDINNRKLWTNFMSYESKTLTDIVNVWGAGSGPGYDEDNLEKVIKHLGFTYIIIMKNEKPKHSVLRSIDMANKFHYLRYIICYENFKICYLNTYLYKHGRQSIIQYEFVGNYISEKYSDAIIYDRLQRILLENRWKIYDYWILLLYKPTNEIYLKLPIDIIKMIIFMYLECDQTNKRILKKDYAYYV